MAIYELEARLSGDSSQLQKSFREAAESIEKTEQSAQELDRTLSDTTASEAAAEGFSDLSPVPGILSDIRDSAQEAALAVDSVAESLSDIPEASIPAVSRQTAAELPSGQYETDELSESSYAVNGDSGDLSDAHSLLVQIAGDITGIRKSSAETAALLRDTASASSETEEQFGRSAGAAGELNDRLEDTEEALDEIQDEAAPAISDIEGSAAEAEEAVDDLNDSLDGTSSSAEKASSTMAKIAVGAAAAAAVKKGMDEVMGCFKEYADSESSIMRVSDIFGSSADTIEEYAGRAKSAFGMAKSAAYSYAATFGNLFKSITADQEENAKLTTAMLNASAVVASRTGRTVTDVMERIRSGLLGNTEAIEDLGIYVNVAMLETTEAFRKMADGRSWEQLGYQEQQQIRALAILEQANKQFGTSVSQNTVTALSSFEGASADLRVSIGQLAAGALTPCVQVLTVFVNGINRCVTWVSSLSSTSRTYLGIAAALALGIPAVTLATKGLAAAQVGLHAIQAILIPQTLTFGTALQATLGWLALAALAIGALYAVFGRKKETDTAKKGVDDYSDSLAAAQRTADNTSKSISGIKDSAQQLSNELRRSLAGFDELNILSGGDLNSQGLFSVDTEGIDQAAEALSGLGDMNYNIGFDTNAQEKAFSIKGFFSGMWEDIKTGFSDWSNWWQGLGADMYEGIHNGDWEPLLTRLSGVTEKLFGKKWNAFWEEAGEGMYDGIHEGDWEPLLTTLDGGVRTVFGDRWSEFWQEKGEQIYDGFHTGDTKGERALNGLDAVVRSVFGNRWSEFWQQKGEQIYDGFHTGDSKSERVLGGLDAVVRSVFGDRWSVFWQDKGEKIYDGFHTGDTKSERVLNGLDAVVRTIFGDRWGTFWEDVGADMYEGVERGDWQPLMDDLDRHGREVFGVDWWNFWQGVGADMYDSMQMWAGWTGDIMDSLNEKFTNLFAEKEWFRGSVKTVAGAAIRGLPHAATGAYVTRPTEILAGEAGAEAIIPLENNTGWMDAFAEKLAARLPSGGSVTSAPIILDGREVGRFCLKAVGRDKAAKGG